MLQPHWSGPSSGMLPHCLNGPASLTQGRVSRSIGVRPRPQRRSPQVNEQRQTGTNRTSRDCFRTFSKGIHFFAGWSTIFARFFVGLVCFFNLQMNKTGCYCRVYSSSVALEVRMMLRGIFLLLMLWSSEGARLVAGETGARLLYFTRRSTSCVTHLGCFKRRTCVITHRHCVKNR